MRNTVLLLACLLACACSCKTADERNAEALARRVMGHMSSGIVFEQTADTTDTYEISQKGDRILIKGNNANSMAVGLNRYLQEFCLADVSWYDFNPLDLPDTLPAVPEPVKAKASLPTRFFLNYCTFGYTMPWWKWRQWEHFIDWMALNGVNMPLAITGQEAVWQKVWRKYGLSDRQIRAFFTGPAHLPWHRMNNIDRWQGPLPQHWINAQAKLQKKILRRERALNMKPVLPAFSGHVPAELAEVLPEPIDTSRVRRWCKFADAYRCTFLSPTDPLFARIQKDFLKEQTRMYGTDHIYGVDLFNEVRPPSWEPEYLAKVSAGVYDSMAAVDPDAVWLQMGWLFISSRRNWTPERIEAYLTAVPQGRMIVLDYESDYVEIWRRTERFYGQKFIWCYLGNFGGMTGIEGDYRLNEERIAGTKAEGGPGFVGIGSTLEGFGVNQPVYEAVLVQAWDTGVSLDEYIDNIADRHLGRVDSTFRAYWHKMAEDVCVTHTSNSSSSMICARPSLEGVSHWTTIYERGYDPGKLEEALGILEKVEGTSDCFKFDLANTRRQVLDNRAPAVRDRFTEAYKAGDRDGMIAAREEFLGLCDSLIAIVKTRPEFSLEDWIRDARSWGRTPREKDYYEMNARTIISVWGDSFHLCDYANRDWDGLIESYYKVRWQKFFDDVIAAYDAGREFDAGRFDRELWDFERRWAQIHSLAHTGIRSTVVFAEGSDSCHFYRIPAMCLDKRGNIVAVCDRRYESLADLGYRKTSIDISCKRSTDGGRTWSPQTFIARGDTSKVLGYGYGDASLTLLPGGRIVCLFACGNGTKGFRRGLKHTTICTSDDGGRTWSKPRLIPFPDTLHSAFVTSGKGVCDADGDILLAADVLPQDYPDPMPVPWPIEVHLFYSKDGGESWTLQPEPLFGLADETKLVQLPDGRLLSSSRRSAFGPRGLNTAVKGSDGIWHWEGERFTEGLDANPCNGDIVLWRDGLLLHSYIKEAKSRRGLTLAVSADGGTSWRDILTLQPGPAAYSTMVVFRNGDVGILYEDGSRSPDGGYDIIFSRIPRKLLRQALR